MDIRFSVLSIIMKRQKQLKNNNQCFKGIILKRNNPTGGWSYVETIIVVCIMVASSSLLGIAGMKYIGHAKRAASMSEIASLSMALDGYYLDCDSYPTTEQGLEALYSKPQTGSVSEGWAGPYLNKKDFTDSWGQPYIYEAPGPDGLPFSIMSYGADRAEGGEGNSADILSWQDAGALDENEATADVP